MIKKIIECRICKNNHLEPIIQLGEQSLTGVFPKNITVLITSGPLNLVKCMNKKDCCGLLQLEHSYDTNEMFGLNYGYQSSLNSSMVSHLHKKIEDIQKKTILNYNDLIIDIGSNDGTTLNHYPKDKFQLVGIDPTASKFSHLYQNHVQLIADFFSAKLINDKYPNKKAKVITSFSMFYDLENPLVFMKEIYDIVDDDGIWVFEQSYMPSMLNKNSFDTICHEHLEYYSLHQIKWMTDKIGFNIIDIEFNDINGGSFSVTVSKRKQTEIEKNKTNNLMQKEIQMNLFTLQPYLKFKENVNTIKINLLNLLNKIKSEGKTISAIGASTKGNVILQYCGIDTNLIDFVGEINKDKFKSYTPRTLIPIISEDELLKKKPDYLLILTWHFEDFFIKNNKFKNCNLIFPLPNVKVISP